MKWILCILVGVLPLYGFSQVALLDKIYDFIQNKELQKAENAILLAEKNVATANDARTFYLKAYIYKELLLQNKNNNRDQLRGVCITSLNRCKTLDHDQSFKQPIKQLHDFIAASIFNDGVEAYNKQDFNQAINHFTLFIKLSVSENEYWLDANYFIGASYFSLEKQDSAQLFLERVMERNYDQPILFVDLSYLYLNQNNEKKALATVERGAALYPEYFDIKIAELNILSTFQKYDTLEIRLQEFLAVNPNNIEVLLMAGSTYEKLGDDETRQRYINKSELAYQKILTLDPKHFDANYNLGVLYYNQAVDIVNKNDLETDIEELTKILERSTKLFEKALPLLLSIRDPKSENTKLLQALQAIYYNLNMKTELAEINMLLKAAGK